MASLLDLPAEVLLKILDCLSAPDLCSVALVQSSLKYLLQDESIWIKRAKQDFNADLKKYETSSPRQFYQHVLHKFGPLFGLWQRTDLRYYSGLIKVHFNNNSVVFEQLKAPQSITDNMKRETIFVIKDKSSEEFVDVEKGPLFKLVPGNIKIMFEDKTLLEEENEDINYVDGIKRVLYNFFTVEPQSVGETDGILRILNDPQGDIKMEELFEKYVAEEVGVDMNVEGVHFLQLFQLQIEKCRETFYSSTSAWYKRINHNFLNQHLKPLPEGLFKGDYGPHGVELIHVQVPATGIKGLKGIKVTGDPNVPFDKIAFEVDDERCLNMPTDAQQSCNSIFQFHQDPQFVDFQVGEIITKARFRESSIRKD